MDLSQFLTKKPVQKSGVDLSQFLRNQPASQPKQSYLGSIASGFRSGQAAAQESAQGISQLQRSGRMGTGEAFLQNIGVGTQQSFLPISRATAAAAAPVTEPIIGTAAKGAKPLFSSLAQRYAPQIKAGKSLYQSAIAPGLEVALKSKTAQRIKQNLQTPESQIRFKNVGRTIEALGVPFAAEGAGSLIGAGIKAAPQLAKGAIGASKNVGTKLLPDVITKDVPTLRTEKMTKGLSEQNVRLKTVNKAYNDNTKNYKLPDGTTETVTPIDTLSKNAIFPEISKGTIEMGDYKAGTGALGQIKSKVSDIDVNIENLLEDTGKIISLDELEAIAIKAAKDNPELRRGGLVSSTISKIENRFNDYRASYGDSVGIVELNGIRKVANKDWHPDSKDVSRIMGDVAREKVYNATDNMDVRTLLKEQGEFLAARKYAEKLHGTKVTGGRWGNYAARTAGAIIGATVESAPVVGPLVGMLGGEYMARALQQSQFKSLGAEVKALFQRSKSFSPTQSAKKIPKIETKTSIPKPISQSTKKVKLQDIIDRSKPFKKGETPPTRLTLPSKKGIIKDVDNTLLQEAKKYKTAEEFVDEFTSPKKHFQILHASSLKKPKNLYRGVGSSGEGMGASGGGAAVEGHGLYTTTKKNVAKGYADAFENGQVLEMNPLTDIPENPIYFRSSDAVRDWVLKSAKKLGMTLPEFGEKIGINKLVKSLGFDGVAFDMNGGVTYVKYPK